MPGQLKATEGVDRKPWQFVKLPSSEYWLLHAMCGPSTNNRITFGRSSWIRTLRDHIVRLCDGTEDIDAVARCSGADTHDVDPIDKLVFTEQPPDSTSVLLLADLNGRKRYYRNKAKNCITTVNVPSRPPEIDPDCRQLRAIKLFIQDRKTVWLHVDDLPWAIEYSFNQVRCKGVPAVDANDPGP